MARQIDTDAVINWERLAQQSSNPASPAAGYWYMFVKSDGLYLKDSSANVLGPLSIMADGWTHALETWTYASADDPTFTFTVPTDLTTKYYAGMRVKLTQSTGGTKYFIITKTAYGAPNTTITVYGGTDYNLENEAISAPYYSVAKAPAGFPLDPTKWTVVATDTSSRTQATPTQNQWYNLTGASISLPIGIWRVRYSVLANATDATSAGWAVWTTLSTANNSESDTEMTARLYFGNVIAVNGILTQEKVLVVAAKATYYLNIKTSNANLDNMYFNNDVIPMIIRATCSYL